MRVKRIMAGGAILVVFGFILVTAKSIKKVPTLDSIIPANTTLYTRPIEPSTVGATIDLDLRPLNEKLKEYIGTTFEERTGFSVKVRVHKVVINEAEEAAIKVWHETKCAAANAECEISILACNRYIRSSDRRRCRDRNYRERDANIASYNATKQRRLAANRRDEVEAFEVRPSSGENRYVIASARLDALEVSSLEDEMIVKSKIHCGIKVNIENPFDHSKEFKGVVNEEFDVMIKIRGRIEFTKDGKISLANRKVDFEPKFQLSGILSPLSGMADKVNAKIEQQINKQIDKQLENFEFKKQVDEALVKLLVKLTRKLNERMSADQIWILPGFERINFRTDKRFAHDPMMLGINMGLTFRPEIVISSQKPQLPEISYDIELSNQSVPDHISIRTNVTVHLKDVSPILTGRMEPAFNEWLKKQDGVTAFAGKRFQIEKIDLLTSNEHLLLVLYTKRPVSGTMIFSTKPVLRGNGRIIAMTEPALYSGTRNVLTEETAWVIDLPLGTLLADLLDIDVSGQVDRAFQKIEKDGLPIGSVAIARLIQPSFFLDRLSVGNGNLILGVALDSKLEIVTQ